MSDVVVYSVGVVHASACYPAGMDLEDLTAAVNRIAGPTGVGPWTPSDADTFASGQTNPCPCDRDPDDRLHRLFNC